MTRLLSLLGLTLLVGSSISCDKGGPLRVDKVEPEQGLVSGGDLVTIKGGGFQPGKTQVEIRFGRVRAEQVSIASTDKITVVTPPGDRGPVDVTLMFDDGTKFKIPEGFRYAPLGAGSDVRNAFFSGKPGEKPTGAAPEPAK
ncbi:MAG TPA: IPT/TIG domain-containing protein [Polyangia bacterium]